MKAGIVQVEDIIYRPITQLNCEKPFWKFVLTMMETNLDSTSYEDLEDGVYNSLSMNQIGAHDTTETLALDEFVQETPNGFQSTYTSGCPETYPSTHGRPMFGWKCYNEYISSDENCTYTMCGSRRKYFFWILVKEQTDVEISRVCP